MLKKKEDKNMDLLLANFAGELVEVIIDKDIEHSQQSEDNISVIKSPVTTRGFLTDIDDSFIFLGHEQNFIHQAINRDFVVYIGLAEEEMVEMLMDSESMKPGDFN